MRDSIEKARSRENLRYILTAAGGHELLARRLSLVCNRTINRQTVNNWLARSGVSKEGAVLIMACKELSALYDYTDFYRDITTEDIESIRETHEVNDGV